MALMLMMRTVWLDTSAGTGRLMLVLLSPQCSWEMAAAAHGAHGLV